MTSRETLTANADGCPEDGRDYKEIAESEVSLSKRTTGPVPLYLVPPTLSKEFHELGRSVTGAVIRRTSGHKYVITVTAAGSGNRKQEGV